MKENEVLRKAFAMPLTNPAYSVGPYRFYNREYLIITYRTDPSKLLRGVHILADLTLDLGKVVFDYLA